MPPQEAGGRRPPSDPPSPAQRERATGRPAAEHGSASAVAAVSPAWRDAAARLVQALAQAPDAELRLSLLKRLARQFGELGYPGFLKLLLIVAESDEAVAKHRLAGAFALGLRRLDLPCGQLTSWGGGNVWPALQQNGSMPAHRLSSAYAANAAPRRPLGPLEYLTVWYCQRTQRPYLSETAFRQALARLIELLDHDTEVRRLYPLKIQSDLATGVEGAYTRQTRERLLALAQSWSEAQPPAAVAEAAARIATPALSSITRDFGPLMLSTR